MGNIDEDNSCDKRESNLFFLSTFCKPTSYNKIPNAPNKINIQSLVLSQSVVHMTLVKCSGYCMTAKGIQVFSSRADGTLPNELSEDEMLIPKQTDNALFII